MNNPFEAPPEAEDQLALELATKEIAEVLTRHKLQGVVSLASKSGGKWLYHLDAPWSGCTIEKEAFRIKLSKAQIPDAALRKKKLETTIAALGVLMHLTAHAQNNFTSIFLMLGHKFDVEFKEALFFPVTDEEETPNETPTTHTTHTTPTPT